MPDRGCRDAGPDLDPLYFDPTQISANAAVKAAVKFLLADVNAGSVRLRGELNGHVGDIDDMWCFLGDLDVFDRTLTILASESAYPGAARRTYRNIVCHKADVERMIPRMREVDLTPEKHSLAYRLQMSNQRAASQHGFDSVEAYLAAQRDGNIKSAIWVGDIKMMLTELELLAPDIPQKWPPPQDDLGDERNAIAFARLVPERMIAWQQEGLSATEIARKLIAEGAHTDRIDDHGRLEEDEIRAIAGLVRAAMIVSGTDIRADEHQSVKKQATSKTYSNRQDDMRARTGRWATRVEDEKWARDNGYPRDHVRGLRRDFSKTLSISDRHEFHRPGPRKPSV